MNVAPFFVGCCCMVEMAVERFVSETIHVTNGVVARIGENNNKAVILCFVLIDFEDSAQEMAALYQVI